MSLEENHEPEDLKELENMRVRTKSQVAALKEIYSIPAIQQQQQQMQQ